MFSQTLTHRPTLSTTEGRQGCHSRVMTRRMTIAASVLAALCTLSACGADTAGDDGSSPSAGTEDQTGGSEEGSDDGGESSGATTIPADQSDVTPEEVCAAIPVADLPVPVETLKPFDDPSPAQCMIDRADNFDVTTSVKFEAGTKVDGDGTTIDGRDASVQEAPGAGCLVTFSRGDDSVGVELATIESAYTDDMCDTAQAIAEVVAPQFPES